MKPVHVIMLAAVILGGCASGAAQQAQAPEKRQSGTELPATDSSPRPGDGDGTTSGSVGCDRQSADGFGLFREGRHRLNGKEIFVTRDSRGEKLSLCDVLDESGKDVVFFQFAGVTCIECQEKGQHYQQILGGSRYSNVQWVVVITDFFTDYSEPDFENYMDLYGRGAVRVHDEAKLWKALSEDPTIPTRATTFAMNKNMDVEVINKTGTSKDAIVEAALKLAAEAQ